MPLRHRLPEPVKQLLRPVWHGGRRLARTLLRSALSLLRLILGKKRFLALGHTVAEEVDPTVDVAGFRLDARAEIPLFRAVTFLTKEPDTIAWIDDYVKPDDVFYDVGANVGVFTLYAARKKARVIAFEPFSENYAILNRNIFLNDLSHMASALNIALHDQTVFAHLNISMYLPGKAAHSFVREQVGSDWRVFTPQFRQGMVGFRMDELIEKFDLPFPNHVKIDVDGNDPLVVAGMGQMLADPRLRSLAIELNPEMRTDDLVPIQQICAAGFRQLEGERYANADYLSSGQARNHFFVRDPQ